ncbi:MAG TPA: glycosyltransferase family 39 protein [Chloroflexota bacterium]|nr:glycosyltransferase family 39 protein [Chloroflexota bacterium]
MLSARRRRDLAAPLAIILVAWLARAWHLDFYDFRGDEVFGIEYVNASIGKIISTLAAGEPHPPLFYLLLHFWLPVAGDGVYALRWLSTAGDVLSVALLYVLARRLGGPLLGVVAALLLALAPYHIWNAQDARMYTLATACAGAAVYWAWRLLLASPPQRRDALAYVLAMLLALYTHYYSLYVLALVNAFAVPTLAAQRGPAYGRQAPVRAVWSRRLRLWAAAQTAVALLYTPWLVYAWQTLTTYHGNAGSPTLPNALRDAARTFALGFDLPQRFASPLLPLYVVALTLGVVALLRLPHGRPAVVLLLLWLLFPIGAIWYGSRTRPIFDVRYLIEASPPFYLLLALPAVWWRRRPRLPALVGAVAVLVVVAPLLPALWSLYFHPTDGRGHAYSALGRYLSVHAGASDLIIINHLDPVVRYYARRSNVVTPLLIEPARQQESPQELDTDLSRLATDKRRVWLIPDDIGAWDGRHTVLAWCNRHLQALGQVANGFHVIEFAPWKPTANLDLRFGAALTLTGLELPTSNPAAGQPWRVVLFWTAPAPTPSSETVSVQLLNAAGQLTAQLDAAPQGGQAPTTGWLPGETVPDPHTLHLPATLPPGRYTLSVAVYPSAGGPRLAVAGAAGNLAPIASVTVR